MTDLVITSRTLSISLIVGVVAIAVAATIGYNVGFGSGTKLAASRSTQPGGPVANVPAAAPTSTQPGGSVANVPAEIPISGEPVTVAGKTILSGTVRLPSATGFTLDVTTQILNTSTRRLTPKTTSYQVVLTKSTQIVQQTTTVTIPYQGAIPQVTTSTKKVGASAIQAGSEVTVTTNDPTTSLTLTALEVRLTTVVRK